MDGFLNFFKRFLIEKIETTKSQEKVAEIFTRTEYFPVDELKLIEIIFAIKWAFEDEDLKDLLKIISHEIKINTIYKK